MCPWCLRAAPSNNGTASALQIVLLPAKVHSSPCLRNQAFTSDVRACNGWQARESRELGNQHGGLCPGTSAVCHALHSRQLVLTPLHHSKLSSFTSQNSWHTARLRTARAGLRLKCMRFVWRWALTVGHRVNFVQRQLHVHGSATGLRNRFSWFAVCVSEAGMLCGRADAD